MERKRLTDILSASTRETLRKSWGETKAAEDFAPLPPGEYVARIIDGALITAKTGTPAYKLTFKVLEGEHVGRRFWHDIWLTDAALPMAKRDLGKLGVTDLDQLDQPLPQGIRCRVRLSLRRDDDGNEGNRVKQLDTLGIDPPEPDPFAPSTNGDGKGPTS
jgi:hypothetical protein